MASTTASVSIDRVSTGGAGTTVDFATAKRNVTMVVFMTGTVTGGSVTVQASHDGTNWVNIASVAVEARTTAFSSNMGAYRYWRAVIGDAVKGGGTLSATFMESD